jgi:DNA-binding NtrC family response regulator
LDLDVRFLASTHRDLEAMVQRGEFRQDLFFRLAGARIHIPPLRAHPQDIRPLVEHYAPRLPEGPLRLQPAALKALERHRWPGNVRELIGTLRRLAVEFGAAEVGAREVEAVIGVRPDAGSIPIIPPEVFHQHSYAELLRRLDESHLRHLLGKHGGNIEKIARELKTTTRSVYRRFQRLGLKPGKLERK